MEFKTIKGEDFLLVNSNETNILGFSAICNLQPFCSLNLLFVDGTFKSCPKLYYQLFTIHGVVKNNYVPLVYFLLLSKTTNCYTAAFQHLIEEECIKNDMLFNLVRMYIDFEKAIHAAANTVRHSIKVKGCRFHLGQSWRRKIQQLGLSTNYKKKINRNK